MQESKEPVTASTEGGFKPFVSAEENVAELTIRSIILGAIFGILFGMASVYLALKAGLTVSASIPVAVLSISLGRIIFKRRTTILENNIIQTTASAGESIASGVVFTLPAFLFLSIGDDGKSIGESYFNYITIFSLAVLGGLLGTLMMIPLRRSLIVKEHGKLPYPEGTACGSVLIAGEKGGDFAKAAYLGVGAAAVYATLQRVFHIISDVPQIVTKQTNKYYPSAVVSGEITPEYLGVGYIIGFRIAGVLVAGGVLAWLCLIPLLASLVPPDVIAAQLVKLGYLKDVLTKGGPGGWDPDTHTFADYATAIYKAYIRIIGAGTVAAGGFITLLKTIPTIVSSFRESVKSLKDKNAGGAISSVLRTDRDMSFNVVIFGSIALILLMAFLPFLPGSGILSKLLIGILVVVFGFFFVTVSSRIVGIIGSTNNPISGMTIATIMGTSLVFIAFGLTGKVYEPMVLVVGSMICIAAANGGATSQDLKTGYIVGATPRAQQISLFTGAVVSSLVIGITVYVLDIPSKALQAQGIHHAIGTTYAAPQGTLMATLIKGLLSHNLDWQFVIVGVIIAIVLELCHINALSFAVGAYLPLSTTLPIFIGGCVKGVSDAWLKHKKRSVEEGELGHGSLFATGLVAGGALFGVIIAMLNVNENVAAKLGLLSVENNIRGAIGENGYFLLGASMFAGLALLLFRMGTAKK